MFYFQSMHNETLRINDKEENTYLNRIYFFFCKFSFRVILSRSSFIPTSIFRKNLFFFIFNMVYFLTTAFCSRHVSFFFYHFSFDASKYFFEENEYDTHFFKFFIFIYTNKMSFYFEKESE